MWSIKSVTIHDEVKNGYVEFDTREAHQKEKDTRMRWFTHWFFGISHPVGPQWELQFMRPGATCCRRRRKSEYSRSSNSQKEHELVSQGLRRTKDQRLSTICSTTPAAQPLLKAKSAPLKVGKGPLFEIDGALAHKTRSAQCHLLAPFFLFQECSGHRHRLTSAFHLSSLFSVKVMLRIKDMTIFSISLETRDKSPRGLAKIRAGYSSCHSAPVLPHSKYTNLSLLTLIIHKQHKGWNGAGWSLFIAPKCFISLKMCPQLFSPPRPRTSVRLSFSLE